jgi:hypothetical protein
LNVLHLSDGALRRMIDEPLAMSDRDKAHYERCARCQARREALAAAAERARVLLAVPEASADSVRALTRIRSRLPAPAASPRRAWARFGVLVPRAGRPLVLAAAVALIALPAAAATEPIWIQIFAPRSAPVTAVSVQRPTQDEIVGLPDLQNYGTLEWVKKPITSSVLSADEAQSATGLTPIPIPSSLAGKPVTYTTVTASEAVFTFSADKAKQAAAAAGKPAPVFPAGIDGAKLDIKGGPAIVEVVGQMPSAGSSSSFSLDQVPVVLAQSRAPVVTSTGVRVKQLEDFLVQQPGIAEHPDLVAQIKAIGDPIAAGELVLPVPTGYATSTPITVGGQQGQLVTDKTGVVRAAIWEKNDVVYAVGGHLDQAAVLAMADGLGR